MPPKPPSLGCMRFLIVPTVRRTLFCQVENGEPVRAFLSQQQAALPAHETGKSPFFIVGDGLQLGAGCNEGALQIQLFCQRIAQG